MTLGATGGIGLVNAQSGGSGAGYTAVTPCRLVDTRAGDNNVGDRATPFASGESDTFAARGAQGQCSAAQLPPSATALALNVTALRASEQTFLTFWPEGARPNSSSLNPSPGAPPTPNAVITQLGAGGSFDVYNEAGNVGLIVDVVGYFTGLDLDEYVTEAEQTAEFDNFLDVLTGTNGPVKINTRGVAANQQHIERTQTVAVNRFDFHPVQSSGDRQMDKGVYIPSGASNSQLWAAVDIPSGAIVTGVRARILDNTGGASLGVQFYQVAPNGIRQEYATKITTNGSSSTSVREFSGNALFRNDSPGLTYEVLASIDLGNSWQSVNDDLQLVGFFVDYKMEVEPVL